MKNFLLKNHRLAFYSCWLLLGIIQSGLTELLDDEAYYWVYGQYLDWGYFDHPPMIALLVKIGYSIFPNELGVRLMPMLLNLFSLLIIEKLLDKKNPLLFYIIAMSMAALQLAGFLAVPDIPLIFFSALFFLCYKRFIGNYSLLNTALLGAAMALLLYSKYHAVLIIFFTLLSNLKLATKWQAWLACIIGAILFTPHLWWQYQHDWISFRYHLFESNVNPYKFSYTINYILGQLLLPGPLAGFILLPAAFLYKTKNPEEKALKFTLIGIYAFFLLSSFRGKVEGNWTSPVMVPLIVLAHQFITERVKWQRILWKLLPITLVLVLFTRVIMIANILPVLFVERRYHAWKEWPQQLRQKTQGLPVVFSNSYQRASKYWFYSGQMTYSLNLYQGRENNYNFWPIEDSLIGKQVYYFDIYDLERFSDSIQTPSVEIGWKYDSAFVSYAKVKVDVTPKKLTIKKGEKISLNLNYTIPDHYLSWLSSHPAPNKDTVRIAVFNKQKWITDIKSVLVPSWPDSLPRTIETYSPLPKGKYFLRIAINRGYRNPTNCSDKVELTVE